VKGEKAKQVIKSILTPLDIRINGNRPWDIQINNPKFYQRVMSGGSLALGESYMDGWWDCEALDQFIDKILRVNLDKQVKNKFRLAVHVLKSKLFNLQKISRAYQVGEKHYDIGNELFRLFLDDTMMYSSAYYENSSMDLANAAVAKLDLVCKKLQLNANDHLLEIGTGWGGLAIHAALHYGCKVTTTTISEEQFCLATEKVRKEGLDDRVSVVKQDYRDLSGEYDKLVSIEMIEAIGHQYMDTYFKKCASLLKADGMMLIQAITIREQLYENALKDVDFIKKYIFPGGFLPSVTAMSESIGNHTDMKLFHLQDIGPHYAKTLQHWRENFFNKLEDIRDLGYSEEFIRLWEYYFCYCEGGFLERDIGTVQMLLTRPENRRSPVML